MKIGVSIVEGPVYLPLSLTHCIFVAINEQISLDYY